MLDLWPEMLDLLAGILDLCPAVVDLPKSGARTAGVARCCWSCHHGDVDGVAGAVTMGMSMTSSPQTPPPPRRRRRRTTSPSTSPLAARLGDFLITARINWRLLSRRVAAALREHGLPHVQEQGQWRRTPARLEHRNIERTACAWSTREASQSSSSWRPTSVRNTAGRPAKPIVGAMATTGPGEGKKAAAGSSLHSKTLLKSEQLYQYILESTVFPREPDCLRELRIATTTHPMAGMAASPDQVQLFGLLIEMLGARNAIEVGVFTGYSLLATALALPDDGKIVAIDVTRESYDMIGSPVVEKAGMAHKIDFRVGLALPVLDQLVAEEGSSGKFDFAFVDADKANFHHYHERLLRLVRVGGLIAYDNTLWGGSVAAPDDETLSERDRELAGIAREFNATLTADCRVQVCQLAISDGIMLCRRVA